MAKGIQCHSNHLPQLATIGWNGKSGSIGNYVAMWLLNYSGCGTFRDFESDIFMNFRLWVSLLVNLACTTEKI